MISIRQHPIAREDARSILADVTLAPARRPRPSIAARAHRATTPPPAREGLLLGGIVAICTWLWVALVDLAVGRPFETFSLLGGIVAFTALHVVLCLVYGGALATAARAAAHEPGLILAAVFGSLLLEVAFAMLAALLSVTILGALAWLRIFVGSLLGGAVAFATLNHWHPITELLHQAEVER